MPPERRARHAEGPGRKAAARTGLPDRPPGQAFRTAGPASSAELGTRRAKSGVSVERPQTRSEKLRPVSLLGTLREAGLHQRQRKRGPQTG